LQAEQWDQSPREEEEGHHDEALLEHVHKPGDTGARGLLICSSDQSHKPWGTRRVGMLPRAEIIRIATNPTKPPLRVQLRMVRLLS
jgi:hypothetical protein